MSVSVCRTWASAAATCALATSRSGFQARFDQGQLRPRLCQLGLVRQHGPPTLRDLLDTHGAFILQALRQRQLLAGIPKDASATLTLASCSGSPPAWAGAATW